MGADISTAKQACDLFIDIGMKVCEIFNSFNDARFEVSAHGVDELIKGLVKRNQDKKEEIGKVSSELLKFKKDLKFIKDELLELAKENIEKAQVLIDFLMKDMTTGKDFLYAANRMIELVQESSKKLDDFKIKYKEVNNKMSEILTKLMIYDADLQMVEETDVKAKMKSAKKEHYQGPNKILKPFSGLITSKKLKKIEIELLRTTSEAKDLRGVVEQIQAEVESTEKYIEREIGYVRVWTRKLNVMKPDFDSIELLKEAVDTNKPGVLKSLESLQEACNNYISGK